MKFSVLLSSLKKPLEEVSSIAGAAPNKEDITQNILMNVTENLLTLRATNYNIELKTVIPVTEVFSEGEITVNANKLKETLSSLDLNSTISFNLDEDKNVLVISTGITSFEIRTRSSIDFPSFEVEDIEQEIVLKQSKLKQIIESSIFCVSNEDFRDYLKGIRIELNGNKLEVFTSDGHRMAILETMLENQDPNTGSFAAIITKRCAAQLKSLLSDGPESEVVLKFTKNALLTSFNNYSLASKLIKCNYPNVRAVIPKVIDTTISIPKAEFFKLIKQVSTLSSKRVNGVTFNFGDGKVLLRSENSEHENANSVLVLPNAQTPIETSLNAQYLIEVLGVIKSDNVLFCFSQPMVHVLIKPDTNDNNDGLMSCYIISKVVV